MSVCDFTIYNTIFLKNDFKYIKDSLKLTISKNYINVRKILLMMFYSLNNILVLLDQKNYLAIARTLKVNYDGEQNIKKRFVKQLILKFTKNNKKQMLITKKLKY